MAADDNSTGEIREGSLYTLPELERRLGLGKAALRSARQDGLKVRKVGRIHVVLGREFLEWVATAAPVI